MTLISFLVALSACAIQTSSGAAVQPGSDSTLSLLHRALPANAPHGYTPQYVSCPSDTPTIRSAASLSNAELQWLPVRRNATLGPMKDLLRRANITGFDAMSYITKYANNASALPNIGIAVSGGGYRALLNGAGVLEAFDSRTTNSTAAGQLGGLLQSATYLAGLSGGSWLVTSLYTNNFTSIDRILASDTSDSKSGDLWQFEQSIFDGPEKSGIQLLNSIGYYAELVEAVQGKKDAGFNVTITDYWGRALSYQLVNATDGGPDFTFSSIARQEWFTNGSVPLPVIVTDNRSPGQEIISENSTVFSFNPWELGSFDPTVFAFADLEYVGTNYSGGRPVDTDKCVFGFDNVGFMTGTSSTLFNEALIEVNGTNTTGLIGTVLKTAIEGVLEAIGEKDIDIADYPNPFYGYNVGENRDAGTERLTLVDGGEDGQNIPLNPLIQPIRNVDVIFAVDSSADTDASYPTDSSAQNWPVGISMVATYERTFTSIGNGTGFPSVPDTNTFINLGLNSRPTFFGCNASNLTTAAPLIVYLPNAPYSYTSNVSTFDLKYSDSQRDAIVLNAYNGATQGNGTLDSEWPTCVGCAIISRSLNRTGTAVPEVCERCFDRYCWNGTIDSTTPRSYVPALKLQVSTSDARPLSNTFGMALVAAIVTGVSLI